MIPRRLPFLAAALFLVSPITAAVAGIPSPADCTVPNVIIGSPDGAFTAQVIVRDLSHAPLGGVLVTLDFSMCPQFRPCPSVCTGCAINSSLRWVQRLSNANGIAAFSLRLGGGGCPNPPTVRVYVDGYLAGLANFAPLDQDGDLTVTTADLAQVHAVLGAVDLRADFDGDGLVTEADETILLEHLDVTCDPATPVRSRTWGGLKSIYR